MPKGKKLGVGWGVGRKGGRRGIRGIMISTHNVVGGGQGRQYSTEKTSSDPIASYYTDEQ